MRCEAGTHDTDFARLNTIKRLDWEAVAGIIAACIALLLHLLHIAEESVLLAVALVILAVILLRDLRREAQEERDAEVWQVARHELHQIAEAILPPEVVLVGPRELRTESERFAQRSRGEQLWFNVCLLMFVPQSLFDVLLKPAILNPRITRIQFVLDSRERQRWEQDVMPKIAACDTEHKVQEPRWSDISEAVSFIIGETDNGTEAQLSFWGEPFMSRTPGGDIPRYVFHVLPRSDLVNRLDELARGYRISRG